MIAWDAQDCCITIYDSDALADFVERSGVSKTRLGFLRMLSELGFRLWVILGSGGPGLLYLYKRVCRPPGGRGGAGEGYMGASDGALSPGGSIWLTSRPVLVGLGRGAGLDESSTQDLYSTKCFLKGPGPLLDTSWAGWKLTYIWWLSH